MGEFALAALHGVGVVFVAVLAVASLRVLVDLATDGKRLVRERRRRMEARP